MQRYKLYFKLPNKIRTIFIIAIHYISLILIKLIYLQVLEIICNFVLDIKDKIENIAKSKQVMISICFITFPFYYNKVYRWVLTRQMLIKC